MEGLMGKIVSLCKRRGFIFPSSEIYGGISNTWDYGPVGVELKNNIKQLWWKRFVQSRDDMVGIDAALIMNPKVWEASGHLKEFSDPLVECRNCHQRFRPDEIRGAEEAKTPGVKVATSRRAIDGQRPVLFIFSGTKCPNCDADGGKYFVGTDVKQFNLMFKTFVGPTGDDSNVAYFRPETAQAMFVDFKNVVDTTRKRIPFGIAQIGKAFRNEITPGNFIFRTREFEQMEIEYFIREGDWEKYFEEWREEMKKWIKDLGIDLSKVHEEEIGEGERAHYSKRTIDFMYDFPFGRSELYGLAYRTDFDLKNHNLRYKDETTGEEFYPHVIEPTWGVDRSVLAVLLEAYREDGERVILKIKPGLAPYKAAVFPLLANKPELMKLAKSIYDDLRQDFMVDFDDRGNIGKRYYSQDEIGTPWCVTVDFQSLEDGAVTVRDRDTAEQKRVNIKELKNYISHALQENNPA